VTTLTTDQVITLTEILVILLGIGIAWAVYHGSDQAELPGEAREPTPALPDDTMPDLRGRTL
jgi:hypothetical protein